MRDSIESTQATTVPTRFSPAYMRGIAVMRTPLCASTSAWSAATLGLPRSESWKADIGMLWDSTSSASQTVISRQPILASIATSWLPTDPAPMTVTGCAEFGSKTSSCWEKLSVGRIGHLLFGAAVRVGAFGEIDDELADHLRDRGDRPDADAGLCSFGVRVFKRLGGEPARLVVVRRLADVRPLVDLHGGEGVRVSLGEPPEDVADRVGVALFSAGLGDRPSGVAEARPAVLGDVRMRDAVLVGRRLAPDRDRTAFGDADGERAHGVT